VDVVRWQLTFRIRSRSTAPLSARALRPWWSVFPDQPGALLTDGSLLLVTMVDAPTPQLALILGRHRVTEFFSGRQHSVEHLTLSPEDW